MKNDIDFSFLDYFNDWPPADPICFNMAKLAEPELTYYEFVRRWREKTIELRNERNKDGH